MRRARATPLPVAFGVAPAHATQVTSRHAVATTYEVRVGATDLAGNHQSKVATGTLTVG